MGLILGLKLLAWGNRELHGHHVNLHCELKAHSGGLQLLVPGGGKCFPNQSYMSDADHHRMNFDAVIIT